MTLTQQPDNDYFAKAKQIDPEFFSKAKQRLVDIDKLLHSSKEAD